MAFKMDKEKRWLVSIDGQESLESLFFMVADNPKLGDRKYTEKFSKVLRVLYYFQNILTLTRAKITKNVFCKYWASQEMTWGVLPQLLFFLEWEM